MGCLVGVTITVGFTGCGQPERHLLPQVEPLPLFRGIVPADSGRIFRGAFSPDGTDFYYFRKIADGAEDYRVYRTQRLAGSWSTPELLPLGDSNASSMYPVVSPDGALLVFTSDRPGDGQDGSANVWVSRRVGVGWGDPVLLGEVSTPGHYDAGPWFGPGGELHVSSTTPDWASSDFLVAERLGEAFQPAQEDSFWDRIEAPHSTHHLWSGVVNQAGTIAVMELSERREDGSLGHSDLWGSWAVADGWSVPTPLLGGVNTEGVENFPMFTPADTTIVFVRDFTEFWEMSVSMEVHRDSS